MSVVICPMWGLRRRGTIRRAFDARLRAVVCPWLSMMHSPVAAIGANRWVRGCCDCQDRRDPAAERRGRRATGDVPPASPPIQGPDTGLSSPNALAVHPHGDLWVANVASNTVTEYPRGATGDAMPMATVSIGIDGPSAITITPAGELLVADRFANRITGYDVDNPSTVVRSIVGNDTGLNFPNGIDVDAGGQIYVANAFGDSITVYAANAINDARPPYEASATASSSRPRSAPTRTTGGSCSAAFPAACCCTRAARRSPGHRRRAAGSRSP
jgi:sugar lactone lactonase YvrE